MKKRLFLLLSSFLFITSFLLTPLASADEPSLSVVAEVDNAAKAVTITGTISSGAGQQVTVLVTHPSGSIDYIDQTTSGSGGRYAFRYTLDDNRSGTYMVKAGGSGVSSPATTTFTYSTSVEGVAVTGVSVTPKQVTLDTEEVTSASLTATVSPADATNKQVEWSSSDEAVAVVSPSGLVTAQGAGTAIITATTVDGGKTDAAEVTVHDATPPSAPANVTATATRNTVSLNWQASTDNVGVAGYEVEAWRGKKLMKTAFVSDTSFTDTGLQTNTLYLYLVRARDDAGNVSAAASIDVRTRRPGNSGNSGSSGGGGGSQEADSNTGRETEGDDEDSMQRTHVVNADSLVPSDPDSGFVTVMVPAGKEEVLLPANAAELLGSSSLRLQSGRMTMIIQPEVLAELLHLADNEGFEDASISLQFAEGAREEADETMPIGQSGTRLQIAGQVLQFDLAITTKDGVARRLSAFSQPIEVAFSYDADADENLLGIYYRNEDIGMWEYIGGEIDADLRRIVAKLYHFSTYAVLEYEKIFADVPANHWASPTIKALAAKHVISGVTDTTFAPQQTVNRASFTALLVRGLGLKAAVHSQPFRDVPGSAWYAGDVAAAYEAGIVSGQAEGLFLPHGNITREEMAAMLVRAYAYAKGGQGTASSPGYADQDEIAAWAVPYVNRAAEAGLMIGSDARMFAPRAFATRAEAAQAIYNLLAQLN
ncbi:hypothetical protein DUZ99_10110 [Xylanibacillus composti]|uniref:S-layer family protein n=1 Tax=Xylanibacillus composti TaxID=1572762 RepID=A0A8J4H403_9BACL|nr:S-layer homology domain-containing protein [Xylanibacillus composti]MDT9725325.1 hypothetical protein [Xylanibacillus composti]GIQ69087.1 hypothetical protein XYCOK13_19110 [Xylanibacillus composti]